MIHLQEMGEICYFVVIAIVEGVSFCYIEFQTSLVFWAVCMVGMGI